MRAVPFLATVSILLAALAAPARAFYGPDDEVKVLDGTTLDKFILDSPIPVMVEFYAPWCGHCKNLTPEWKKVAKKLRGIVAVAAVDLDADKELAAKVGVRGFPTIRYYGTEVKHNPYKNNEPFKEHEDVTASRSAKGLVAYAHSKLPSDLVTVANSKIEVEKAVGSKRAAVVLFAKGDKPKPLGKSLALRFRGRGIGFVQVPPSVEGVAEYYGVESPPAIVIVSPGANGGKGGRELYKGELEGNAIADWIISVHPQAAAPPASAAERPPPPQFYTNITDRNYGRLVEDSPDAWVILELPGAGEAAADIKRVGLINDVALLAMGYAKFGVVRSGDIGKRLGGSKTAGKLKEAAKGKRPGSSKAVVYYIPRRAGPAKDRSAPAPVYYDGKIGEKKNFAQWLAAKLPEPGNVIEVMGTQDIQQFFQPTAEEMGDLRSNPGSASSPRVFAPKVVIFTKQTETSPLVKSLAMRFGKLAFAEVRATAEDVVKQFQVTSFPKVMLVSPVLTGKKDDHGNPQLTLAPAEYTGSLKYGPLSEFIAKVAGEAGVDAGALDDVDAGAQLVKRIHNQESWEKDCAEQGGLCVIFAFAGDSLVSDPDGEVAYPVPSKLDEINRVAARSKGKPLVFAWINAERQQDLAKALGFVAKGMYPAALAVNVRRGALGHFVGPFNEESLTNFADSALGGRVRISKLSNKIPPITDEAGMDDNESNKEDL